MSHILCIETSGKTCSVAVQNERGELFIKEERGEQYIHAESLHPFIASVLAQSEISPDELKAIAVSSGPGSYTGLRIGVSAAKGLAYALGIPLIAIGTLELMARTAIRKYPGFETYLALMDARRMEVYAQSFTGQGSALMDPVPVIVDAAFFPSLPGSSLVFFGDGANKCLPLAGRRDIFVPEIEPMASQMLEVAEVMFEQNSFANLAYFEPFYLKEFVAGQAVVRTSTQD